MDTNDAMRAMVGRAGLSLRGASLALGKSPAWLANTLARPGSSEAVTVAAVADLAGYALCAVPRGSVPPGAIVIDPPPGKNGV